MPLNLKSAAKVRDDVTTAQKVKVRLLFEDAAKEMSEKAKHYKGKQNLSASFQKQQAKILRKQLENQVSEIGTNIEQIVKKSMETISSEMVWCTTEWLDSVGFKQANGFVSLPIDIVESISSGQIYDTGWSLSKAIWSSSKSVQEDVYTIVAKGVAENKSVYEIAKELEVYVNPRKRLEWQSVKYEDKVYKIYNRQVDYCSQRLVRTLCQHAYQQSYERTVEKNPFVVGTKWIANGSRVCPLCRDRDGQIYPKGEAPLDHPNGMCILEPVMSNSDKNITDRIANWYNSEEGTYPELDEFSKYINEKYDIK